MTIHIILYKMIMQLSMLIYFGKVFRSKQCFLRINLRSTWLILMVYVDVGVVILKRYVDKKPQSSSQQGVIWTPTL